MHGCGACSTHCESAPLARPARGPTKGEIMHLHKYRHAAGSRNVRSPGHNLRMAIGIAAIVLSAASIGTTAAAPAINVARGSGINLQVTLGTDLSDGACGTDTQLDVTRLDPVNFCYTVTNQSGVTLNYQTLSDDVVGTLLSAVPYTLAPGASHRYNRIITARESQSPTSTWTAYDVHPGYAFSENSQAADPLFADGFDESDGGSSTYNFIDITKIGTSLNLEDDDGTAQVGIGFPFTFYGQSADQVMVAYNGGILFDLSVGFFTSQNVALPDPDLGAAILPYWTDIYYQQPGDGNIYVATLGDAPNRRFVVEWFNLPIMIGGIQQNSATFEAILYEGSNRILFQYADTDVGDPARNDGITTTIGLNAPAGVEAALQYSYHTASVGTGKAILFSPTTPTTFTSSQQTVLAVGVPKISVSPAQFNVTAPAGGSSTSTLNIGNIGDRSLTWNLGAFASNAHLPVVSRYTLPMGNPALTNAGPAPHRSVKPGGARQLPLATPGNAIPAYAIDMDSSSLVSVDASNPTVVNPIAGVGDLILTAGVFVDEDFSRLYAIDYYTYHLLAIDTRSGDMTLVGTADLQSGAGINWNGMAWDASTGTLYGVAYSPGRFGYSSYLYKIDPVTAATTLVGPISGAGDPANGTVVVDIAVDANGLMYGVDLVADDFIAIDKTSGAAAVISSLGFDANFAQGLDFDAYTGTLYYAAFNASVGEAEMYTIDPASGALTLVSPIGADPTNTQLAAFAIARLGGVCAYPNDVPWLAYSSGRGSTAAGGNSPVTVTFNASALSAGAYTGDICVANNDQTNRRVAVPVTLTVQ
jgi:hypothetical protein